MAELGSMDLPELRAFFKAQGLPDYRASQVFEWLQRHGIACWDEATSLPSRLRSELEASHPIHGCEIARKQLSRDGTVKYLFRLHDGNFVESVLLRYEHGQSLCVSSQVGCARGCVFCSSTIGGCERNLSAAEILAQIHAVRRDLNIRIGHIVLMGMGEPLDNLPEVARFLRLVTDENGLKLSMRAISLSTCGVVPGIRQLASLRYPLTLSVSLHAPQDELRSRLMPVNRQYPLGELIPTVRAYAQATGRRVSFEYAMLRGVNDSPEQARQLAALLRAIPSHVNLIPINPCRGAEFQPSSRQAILSFSDCLEKAGITATIRRTLGQDIDAACGQLRKRAGEDIV
ncbi:MAG: 23S rRNA (adenine(2503)-C(2))-methyltransferase RlmN [Clostridium sp.]|jgi:23S rRNA (adenine2503-C2)-methyltransferase|nr:23S rRNA (adenine(2503)-C(2))-methyltransferase RlmN [Clostridium sp.]